MSSEGLPVDVLSPQDVAQVASLDAVAADLQADARSWARRLGELSALALRAEREGRRSGGRWRWSWPGRG